MLESLSLRIALGRREFEDVVVVVCSSFLFSDCLHTTSPVVPFFLLSRNRTAGLQTFPFPTAAEKEFFVFVRAGATRYRSTLRGVWGERSPIKERKTQGLSLG